MRYYICGAACTGKHSLAHDMLAEGFGNIDNNYNTYDIVQSYKNKASSALGNAMLEDRMRWLKQSKFENTKYSITTDTLFQAIGYAEYDDIFVGIDQKILQELLHDNNSFYILLLMAPEHEYKKGYNTNNGKRLPLNYDREWFAESYMKKTLPKAKNFLRVPYESSWKDRNTKIIEGLLKGRSI